MPPRYAYWTILVDELPTAFRAALLEDLQPTFTRLKAKHPTARMVWFQNGKVWNSRLDAQEAMRARGERGRQNDFRQTKRERQDGKLEWHPRQTDSAADQRREARRSSERDAERERAKLEWRPRPSQSSADDVGGPRRSAKREGGPSPQGPKAPRPQSLKPSRAPNRSGERRDKTWRPGGDHKDPRQKYKDAKKAKWTRFKQNIRKRWEAKGGKKERG